MAMTLSQLLKQADFHRRSSHWLDALHGYQHVQQQQPDNSVVAHNIALCHLALDQVDDAIVQSQRALQLNPNLWQSALVLAKALAKRNDKPAALALLQQLHAQLPQTAEIRIELAKLTLHVLGDAVQARQLVEPLLNHEHHGRDAQITRLVTQLYDRDPDITTCQVNQGFLDYGVQQPDAALQAQVNAALAVPIRTTSHHRRLRVGLISPQFFASPVYFFTIGAWRYLGMAVDLIVFNRGSKTDWATKAFQRIAKDWLDVGVLTAEQLALAIARQGIDVLVDLGGWMDPVALQALATKPAKKMYKWVGGQSVTTGLRSFDGFLSDSYQTPAGSDALYSEPLIRLKSGYVTYTAPPYMPLPQPPKSDAPLVFGVIANPAKVSRAFLADLAVRHLRWQSRHHQPITLRLIDYRYQHEAVCQRVRAALTSATVEFVCPASHRDYLSAVAQLDATLDTMPYSGGLTTIEALTLGVPTYTHVGTLFCERHTVAHCHYAGLLLADCCLDRLDGLGLSGRTGQTLLQSNSPRVDHVTLADELLGIFSP
jgi:protein O-GlcNAc transferase